MASRSVVIPGGTELCDEMAIGVGAHPDSPRRVPITLQAEGTSSLQAIDLGRCAVKSVVLPPFHAYLPKSPPGRENDALVILLHEDGRVRFENDDHTGFSTRGHIVIYDECKEMTIESEEPSERIVLTVPKQALPGPVIRRLSGTTFCEAGAPGLPAVFGGFVRDVMSHSRGIPRVHRLKLDTFLLRFVSDLLEVSIGEPTSSLSLLNMVWAEAVHAMETDLNGPNNAPELAKKLNCSVRYIYRAFQQKGTTPAAHLRSIRLQHARNAIIESDDVLICEIAYSVGFQSYSHFSRAFKQEFGLTPETVRTQKRDSNMS